MRATARTNVSTGLPSSTAGRTGEDLPGDYARPLNPCADEDPGNVSRNVLKRKSPHLAGAAKTGQYRDLQGRSDGQYWD